MSRTHQAPSSSTFTTGITVWSRRRRREVVAFATSSKPARSAATMNSPLGGSSSRYLIHSGLMMLPPPVSKLASYSWRKIAEDVVRRAASTSPVGRYGLARDVERDADHSPDSSSIAASYSAKKGLRPAGVPRER